MTNANTRDPLHDAELHRKLRGSFWLGLAGALVGALVAWFVVGWMVHLPMKSGLRLVGLEGAVAGALIGLPAGFLSRGSSYILRAIAAVLAVIACMVGIIYYMELATGKDLSLLFSDEPFAGVGPGTEAQASYNTLFGILSILSYVVAAISAAFAASIRPILQRTVTVPRCLNCSYDLREPIANRLMQCSRCGTPIPPQYRR